MRLRHPMRPLPDRAQAYISGVEAPAVSAHINVQGVARSGERGMEVLGHVPADRLLNDMESRRDAAI